MTTTRKPLRPLPEAERTRLFAEQGRGPDGILFTATPAERLAMSDTPTPAPTAPTPAPADDTLKPGKSTSEWVITVATLALGAFLIVWGVLKGHPELVEKGLVMVGAGQAAYALSRGLAKLGK